VTVAAPAELDRPVRSITTGPRGYEGEGFPVVRAFAGVSAADLDPFIHLDQMGEVEYEPGEPRGTDWHPHRGFETVTYMIDGRFAHQDSDGGGGLITDGATQWMTAGSGVLHIETPPAELVESGGVFHGVQLWVNLPRRDKFASPSYQAIEGGDVGLLSSPDGGALVRRHPHADHDGSHDDSARRPVEPAVEARLQRAGVRAVRPGRRRPGRPSDPAGAAGGARRR
jgi:redox-sensitive bicupin YhaK (pirin superfamily)